MNINLQEVPEKLKKSFILCERILDSVFLVDNSYVYEVKKKSIISSLLLQQNSNDEKLTEQMQIDGAGNDRLQGFCRYDECSVKSVYILILVHSNLFVVQKKDFGLYKMYNNVKDFQIVDELSDGNCKVEIQFHGSSMLTTNFLDYIEKSTSSSKDSFSGIEDAISEMRNNTNEIKGQIAQLEASMDKLFLSVNRNLKFVPNSLISDSADEKQPLVRYGDIWTKLHNEKLVIGIPVLNCTYKQKLVLEDLKLILLDSELNTLEYSWNLYKMRTDCFTFENFEELFDKIDETKDFPNFDQDWNLCKVRFYIVSLNLI